MPATRPPLARMVAIHEDLSEERLPNCSKLAKRFEVSTKTVQRDLEFMRDQLQLPIEYDAVERGYTYTREVPQFPSFSITEGELLAFFVARHALESYVGAPFAQTLRDAFARLTAGMPDSVSFNWETLAARVSFQQVRPKEELIGLFDQVRMAVLENSRFRFSYKGLQDPRARRRTVHPYQVRFVDGGWYLLAWDEVRRAWRVFSLHRMSRPEVLPQSFKRDAGFSPEAFWRDSLGVYQEGKAVRVVLRFRGWAARLAAEREWHSSQRVKKQGETEVQMSFKLQATPELTRWILSWGDAVTVEEPAGLRADIARQLREAAARYGQG